MRRYQAGWGRVLTCDGCHQEFRMKAPGRRARWCSEACRVRAYRARKILAT